jgi:glycosyltransferase involved in cell wall biosynthesis
MNILTISTLYPNPSDTKHGIFVQTRLRHLLKHHPDIQATVIAPVPWFPLAKLMGAQFASLKDIPASRTEHNICIYHPRYLVIPKLGMFFAPLSLTWVLMRTLKKLLSGNPDQAPHYDLIDGHYYFPDGVAIAKVARHFNLPFVCTARGTDINLIPHNPLAKKMIRKVFDAASHNVAVCQALADEMLDLGAPGHKLTVLRNGVDLELFDYSSQQVQQDLKRHKNISSQLVVSVGGLVERKGHHLIIQAVADLPAVTLVIIGDGPQHSNLKKLAEKLHLKKRVIFTGALSQPEVNQWFMAADCSVLASSREGWANVLLESMASGTPVVATRVWGTPEVVNSDRVGLLCDRDCFSIKSAIEKVLCASIARKDVRQYAEQYDWRATSDGQYNLFASVQTSSRN